MPLALSPSVSTSVHLALWRVPACSASSNLGMPRTVLVLRPSVFLAAFSALASSSSSSRGTTVNLVAIFFRKASGNVVSCPKSFERVVSLSLVWLLKLGLTTVARRKSARLFSTSVSLMLSAGALRFLANSAARYLTTWLAMAVTCVPPVVVAMPLTKLWCVNLLRGLSATMISQPSPRLSLTMVASAGRYILAYFSKLAIAIASPLKLTLTSLPSVPAMSKTRLRKTCCMSGVILPRRSVSGSQVISTYGFSLLAVMLGLPTLVMLSLQVWTYFLPVLASTVETVKLLPKMLHSLAP